MCFLTTPHFEVSLRAVKVVAKIDKMSVTRKTTPVRSVKTSPVAGSTTDSSSCMSILWRLVALSRLACASCRS